MKRLIIALIVPFLLPCAIIAGSIKENFRVPYLESEEYKAREKLAKTCTVEEANFVGPIYMSYTSDENNIPSRKYYCVYPDGTVGAISSWESGEKTYKPWFQGIIDTPITWRENLRSELSIEENQLIQYYCFKISYASDVEGTCFNKDIRRKILGNKRR